MTGLRPTPGRLVPFVFLLVLASAAQAQLVLDPATGVTRPAAYDVDVIATGIGAVGDLTVDQSGNLIATQLTSCSPGSGSVFRVTPDGTKTAIASVSRGQGVNPDTISPDLFFSQECGQILRITPAGAVTVFATLGSGTEGVDVRADGTVYVSRLTNIARINRDALGGPLLPINTILNFSATGLSGKFDSIAFEHLPGGATGDLFVLNEGAGGRVLRVNPDTGAFSLFSSYNFSGEAIDVAPATVVPLTGPGNVFVGAGGNVRRISADGTTVEVFATVPGSVLGVAIDAAGVVYISNVSAGVVYRLRPADEEPPILVVPPDISTVTDAGLCTAAVNPGAATATDPCAPVTITSSRSDGLPLSAPFPLGVTAITYIATDGCGNSTSGTQTITVSDDDAPQLSTVVADKTQLWPANHKMVDVALTYEATDHCGATTVSIVVTSNEAVDGLGDGDTSPDWEVVSNHLVRLRAERSGTGNGREYTIAVTATDAAGNTTTQSVVVKVPKSQK